MPASGDRAIRESKDATHSRQVSHRRKRPRPPDLLRHINDGVGAAELAAVVREDAQLGEQFLFGKPELLADARVLQFGDAEAAGLEERTEAAGDGHAEGAIGVEENPAGAGFAAFAVCHFCNERNHRG